MKSIIRTFLYALLIAALCMTGIYLAMGVAYWNFSIPAMGGGQKFILSVAGIASFICSAGYCSNVEL